jgi:hypothetical protein
MCPCNIYGYTLIYSVCLEFHFFEWFKNQQKVQFIPWLYKVTVTDIHFALSAIAFICSSFNDAVTIASTVLEDIWGGAWRGLLRSSSLSQESSVVQFVLRGT